MKKEIKIFNDYVKQFFTDYNLKEKQIMYKYHHTFRVMNFCNEIALSENLTEHEVYIAKVCGLLHDIARFKQWTEFKTFRDLDSFDHGDVGYDIAKTLIDKFDLNKEEQNYVLNAIKYHNKREIPFIDLKTNFYMELVRDADKLDIMIEQANTIKEETIILKDEMLNQIFNNQVIKIKGKLNSTDRVILMISWVNDFNFHYSKELLLKRNILENKFKLLEIYGKQEKIDKLREYAFNKVKEIVKC